MESKDSRTILKWIFINVPNCSKKKCITSNTATLHSILRNCMCSMPLDRTCPTFILMLCVYVKRYKRRLFAYLTRNNQEVIPTLRFEQFLILNFYTFFSWKRHGSSSSDSSVGSVGE